MKKFLQSLNGKKIPIMVVIAFLVGWGSLQAQVANNGKCIDDMKPNTAQIAKVQTKAQMIEESLKDFRLEYRSDQKTLREDIKEILRKVR